VTRCSNRKAAELGLVVGEGLLANIAGEAGVDGVALQMDDARLGQDEADHAAEEEVRRPLVDDMPPPRGHRRDMSEIGLPHPI